MIPFVGCRPVEAVIGEMCRLGLRPQSRHGRKPRVPKERQRILDKIEVILAVTLLWSVWLDRAAAPERYQWFAIYCGGLTVSKGAVAAYGTRRRKEDGDA